MRSITKCLFPAAGLGTRFLPATKEIPKEMLPLIDRPIIHYGVEEAVNSGCSDVVFVTGRGKRAIEDYFDRSIELENILLERGQKELYDMVVAVSEMARFAYVRQSEPLGLGHAVLCGEQFCESGFFGVILPDDVMIADTPVLRQLVELHERLGGSVVALEEVPPGEVSRYGIAKVESQEDGVYRILDLIEKPSLNEAPSCLAVVGRYLLSPRIFHHLHNLRPGSGGELQLTDAIKSLLSEEVVWGLRYNGLRLDCGTKEGWFKATVTMALENGTLREALFSLLRQRGLMDV